MSFRGITKVSTCRNILSPQAPFRLPSPFPKQTQWLGACSVALSAQQWTRGVKTKTVTKAKDLPQGVLPALPPDLSDSVPARTYPPVLQQHLNNMRKFKDCVILTRVGDFYEMYFEQVDQYAHRINLKKAKRATSLGDVPMAGFQHWQLDKYLKMLVKDLECKVAIAEQFPIADSERTANGGTAQFYRKVTRVITAGTLIDESFVDPYESNYLLSVHLDSALAPMSDTAARTEANERYRRTTKVGLSWVDLSSGTFYTQTSDLASLPSVAARIGPREVVVDSSMESAGQIQLQRFLGEGSYSIHFHNVTLPASSVSDWTPMLERAIPEKQTIDFSSQELAAGNLVLDYVRDKLPDMQVRLQPPVRRSDDEYMAVDKQSLRGLEIRSTLRDGAFQGSLLHAIRRTVTKGGARLLGQRISSPSMSLSIINNRLDLVQEMLYHAALREDIVALLRRTSDTLRLLQRFSIGKGDADDLLGLARTIHVMGQTSELLHNHIIARQDAGEDEVPEHGFLWTILDRLDLEGPGKVSKAILAAIDEEGLSRQHTAEEESREETEGMTDEVVEADAAGEKSPPLARRASRAKPSTAKAAVHDTSTDDIWIMRRNASPTLERAHSDLEGLEGAKQGLALKLRKQLGSRSLTLKWSAQLGHFCHIKGKDTQGSISALEGARKHRLDEKHSHLLARRLAKFGHSDR